MNLFSSGHPDWNNGNPRWVSSRMGQMAKEEGSNYDLYTFITHPGASGRAKIGACSSDPMLRISMTEAYGRDECNEYKPPYANDCSKLTIRIGLTAQVSIS